MLFFVIAGVFAGLAILFLLAKFDFKKFFGLTFLSTSFQHCCLSSCLLALLLA